jgi:hypothetical protein
MKTSNPTETKTENARRLARRDWFLLPALSVLTILVISLSTESVTRYLFPVSQTGFENCFVTGDPSGAAPAKPNSLCSERSAESRLPVEYRFNGRGDRDDSDPQTKQPGSFRIVMVGSSFAMGLFVPRDLSFAALLPEELSHRTGRRVELYNESKGGKFRGGPFPIKDSVARFQEVFSARPDMILWIITPMDIENSELDSFAPKSGSHLSSQPKETASTQALESLWNRLWYSVSRGTLGRKVRYRWEQSRSSLVLKHEVITLEAPNQYVDSYLKNDNDAEFLKAEPNAHWQGLLGTLATQAQGFEDQARSAGVPLIAVLLPNRAQAAMISTNSWPAGYDPYQLNNQLRGVIVSRGGKYIDILPDFRASPSPEQYYMPVNGHLTVKGHEMIAQMLAKDLERDMLPLLEVSARPRTMIAQGN